MRYRFGLMCLLISGALLITGCGDDASGPGPEAELIEDYLDAYTDEYLDPEGAGFALAVIGPNGVVIEKTYGMAILEESIPIEMHTAFNLASVSKMFTAMSVLILYEDGELDLDDRITEFFPEGPAAWDEITVHHMLTHQSGFGEFSPQQGWTNEEVLTWLRDEPLEADPGDRYIYSNANYTLLASLVERAADQPFERFMAERIFAPLGMQNSQVVARFPPDVDGGAISYLGSQKIEFPTRAVGATSQYSSIADLMRWEAELRNVTLVSAETLNLALSGHVADSETCDYGYAWHICDNEEWPRDQKHSGLYQGFRTMFYRAPSHGLAVMMASNGAFKGVYGALAMNVAYLYLEGEPWADVEPP